MLQHQTLKKATFLLIFYMSLICYVSHALAQSNNNILAKQIKPDNACGPRCLWALMQVAEVGRTECDIKCIYEIIGKEPFDATNLQDIKDAAEQLGFSAKGYKLTVDSLEGVDGYFISHFFLLNLLFQHLSSLHLLQ